MHAGNATAQVFVHKIIDATLELSIPFEDIDLDYGSAALPHVAQCVEGAPLKSDSAGLARLSLVLKAAGAAWTRNGPSEAKESGWANLGEFLAVASTGAYVGADQAITEFVQDSLKTVRLRGIDAATNAPRDFASLRPELCSLHEAVGRNGVAFAILVGKKLVDGIVATQVGKTGLQLSVPVVPCNALIPQDFCGGDSDSGEPMLKSFERLCGACTRPF